MLPSNASNSTAASLALAIAIVTLVGLVLLIIMFVFSSALFGTMNDVSIAVAALLSVALAWSLYPLHRAQHPQLALPLLILVIVGAVIAIAGSALVISGTTGFVLAGLYMMLGNALIGVWLISLNQGSAWPHGLTVFGLITGGVMALGLASIAGILAGTDSLQSSSWITWIGQMGFFGWAVLYPIWCFRLWQLLRSA